MMMMNELICGIIMNMLGGINVKPLSASLSESLIDRQETRIVVVVLLKHKIMTARLR